MSDSKDLILRIIEEQRGNALDATARDADRAANSTDKMGRSFRQSSSESRRLDTEISRLKTHIHDTAGEISRTGDLKLFKGIRQDQSTIRQLESVKKELLGLGAEGEKAGQEFSQGFGNSTIGMGPQLAAALAGAGILAAPALAAAISGAMTGAVGLGGIAGGLFAASHDPAVVAAAHDFSASISKEFFGSGTAFVPEIIQSLGELKTAFAGLHLGDSFGIVAPLVSELAHGIGQLAHEAMPGFNAALENAKPILHALAQDMPRLGSAIGDFLEHVTQSPGALMGFVVLLHLVEGALIVTGRVLEWLSNRFFDMVKTADTATGFLSKYTSMIPVLGEAFGALHKVTGDQILAFEAAKNATDDATASLDTLGQKVDKQSAPWVTFRNTVTGATSDVTAAIDQLNRSYKDLISGDFSLQEAQDAVSTSLIALRQKILAAKNAGDANATSLSGNSKTALENRAAVRELTLEYEDLIVKTAATGHETGSLQKKFEDQLVKLGFSRVEAHKYAAELNAVAAAAKKIPPVIKSELDFSISGYHGTAVPAASSPSSGSSSSGNGRAVPAYADGGMVTAPMGQPQLAVVHGGERVLTAAQNAAYGMETINVRVVVETPDGRVLKEELLKHKRRINATSLGF